MTMSLKSLLVSATLLACVLGQGYVAFTQWPSTLTPGEPATLKWSGGNGVRSDIGPLLAIVVLADAWSYFS